MTTLDRRQRADHYLLVGLGIFTVVSFFPAVPASVGGKMKVAGVLIALVWLAAVRWSDRPRLLWREQRLVAGAAGGLVVWALASASWAPDQGTAVASAGRIGMGASLLVIIYTAARDQGAVRVLMLAFVAGGALTVAFGVITEPVPLERLSGGVGEPNELASVLLPAIGLALFSWPLVRGRLGRVALALGMVALIVGLLLTDSRGGLVAFAVMLVAALLLAGHLRARIAAVVGVSALLGIGYYVLFASEVSVARMVSLVYGGDSGRLSDGSGRLPLWRLAVELASERPLVGVGAGNFRNAAEQYIAVHPEFARPRLEVVHNTYLEIQTELGLVGLLLFLTLLGGAVAMLVRTMKRAVAIGDRDGSVQARGILVGMTGLLAADLFLSGEYQVQLWWLIGLGIAGAGIGRERVTAQPTIPAPSA